MFKTHSKIIYPLILLFLLALSSNGFTADKTDAQRELMILFTHDLHSYFLPHRILNKEGKQIQQGGYARLACLIDEQRRLHRDKLFW